MARYGIDCSFEDSFVYAGKIEMSLPIKINLPSRFLEKEVRCGFEVSEKLKKIWAVELDLLSELLRVCRKYDIKIRIFGGTLLGAVRHRGFIPWDDDLDVCLDRENFLRLCSVADIEFKHPYFWQTAMSDRRYFLPFARLRNSLTTGVVGHPDDRSYNQGIYVDVYVLEGYPKTAFGFMLHDVLLTLAVKPVTLYYQDKARNDSLRERILRLPRPLVRLLPYKFWVRNYYLVLRMLTPFSKRIGLRHEMSSNARRYWMFKSEMAEVAEVPFEFLSVPAPVEATDILARLYGDYMQFPDPSLRGKWHEGLIHFEPEIPYSEYLSKKSGND